MSARESSAIGGRTGRRLSRRRWLAGLCLSTVSRGAFGEGPWPRRPLRLIAPVPPGGALDGFARGLAAQLAAAVGQPVRVENVVGAGRLLAAQAATRAAPDGYTLLLIQSGLLWSWQINRGAVRSARWTLLPSPTLPPATNSSSASVRCR
jgi:tripartite-type tricarboxylate transporter receptor subunit TctC